MNWRPDRSQLAAVLAALGLIVAVVTVLFGGIIGVVLQSELVLNTLHLIAYLLPGVGVGLIAAVLWAMRGENSVYRSSDPLQDRRFALTESDTKQVGQNLERRLESAASDWYRCEETYSVADIRERLEESAIRVIKVRNGLDDERAVQAIEDGVWTEDPVAAAFLSPHRGQPLPERLRGALNPGQAFHRRVDRTLSAIEELENHSAFEPVTESDKRTETAQEVVAK